MKKILCEKLPRIIKAKAKLEKTLNLKIINRGKEVTIQGNPEDEYRGEKVIDAINLGFPVQHALLIKTKDFLYEVINIKDHTKRKDLKRIRARIIGTKGKTLTTISHLTNCYLEIKENQIGIIGPAESIENAQNAIISIIQGSKQANVYSFLEKHKATPIHDLGLKE